MDANQKDLVRKSFALVSPQPLEAARLFYDRLFALDPALKRLFKGDMVEQGRKLMTMLATAVGNLDRIDTIVPAVRALGARHAGYGVRDEDYGTVATALLGTLEQATGPAFTPETKDAWVAVYTVLAGQMIDAAREATAAAAPREPAPRLKTRLTEAFGLDVPFVNAGMAFMATAPLAAAVCKAGGLGMIGLAAMSPDAVRSQIATIRAATNRAFGVDIIARFSPPEHIDVLVAEKVPLVVFFWDDAPTEWLGRLKAAGSKVWVQIGSVAEARAAIAQGVDGLVVQGFEAGGHNRSTAGLMALLPAVRDVAGDLPLIAAGGIADARAVAAALMLGADGVWVGTRLVASHEANAHAGYKQRIVDAEVGDTAHHGVFGPEFPDATVRGIRNRIVREYEHAAAPYKSAPLETLPIIGEADLYGAKVPMTRFCGFPPTADATGDLEEMSLLAGESVGQVHGLESAEKIVHDMMGGAAALMAQRLATMTA